MGIFDSVQVDEKLNSFFQKEMIIEPIRTPKILDNLNDKKVKEGSAEEITMDMDKSFDSDADSVIVDVNVDSESNSGSDGISSDFGLENNKEQGKSVDKLNDGTRSFKVKQLIEKNQRTIFIGNLPTKVMEKAETKLLKQEFQKYGKLLSIRYRSIAFNMKLPRKQAFIQKKFHENRDSVNAYLVYSSAEEAKSALEINGSLFMERHIRVDFVETHAQKQRDSQRCIFVGNLAFDVSDESIWNFFSDVGEIEYVRVIRDRKTNVGKGFCYVQFTEKASVPLALKLKDNELAGRKIRITRAIESLAQKNQPKTKIVIEGNRATRPDQILKPIERFKKPRLNTANPKKNLNNFQYPLDVKPRLSADGTRIKKPRHVPRVPKTDDVAKKHIVFTDVPESKTSIASQGGKSNSSGTKGIKSRVGSDGKRISKAERLGVGKKRTGTIKKSKRSKVSKK